MNAAFRVCEDLASTQVKHIPACQSDLQTAHIIARRAILERTRARSIRRYCPTKKTARLGRVGRIEQTSRARLALKIRQNDARPCGRSPDATVTNDLADAIQLLCRNHYAADRNAPADYASARARDSDVCTIARRTRERGCRLFSTLRYEYARGPSAREIARVGKVRLNRICVGFEEHLRLVQGAC